MNDIIEANPKINELKALLKQNSLEFHAFNRGTQANLDVNRLMTRKNELLAELVILTGSDAKSLLREARPTEEEVKNFLGQK